MPIYNIHIGSGDITITEQNNKPAERVHKGKSLIDFPADYTIIDLETTGFSPKYDSIIEVSALKIRNGEISDSFSSLVKPYDEIDDFITGLTGIDDDMLSTAPTPEEIFPAVRDFLGDDIIVGHNVNFDINFLYDWFEIILKQPFTNDFIDTMRIAKKVLPELEHHRLDDLAEKFELGAREWHRALGDCELTFKCFCRLKEHVFSVGDLEDFKNSFKHKSLDLHNIVADSADFDETHPLYGKHCVFTGTLEKMTRAEAAQLVVNCGGVCDNGINKKTNFLILGNNDYCSTIKNGKSSKQKKAEEYKLKGQDIEILPESVFYSMLRD